LRISITSFAEGNPFIAEQTMHYLLEQGKISETATGWESSSDDLILLSADIRAMLTARLDQADPHVREVILTASILGKEFEVNILSQMMDLPEDVLKERLKIAEQNAIVTSLSESRFNFQSNLMRDAAYGVQTLAQRQSTHRLAMRSYEKLHADESASKLPELAYHAENGNLIPQAIEYWRKAGLAAAKNFHNQQSIDYYSQAIDLLGETRDQNFVEILLERERIFNLTGHREEQINDLQLANQIADLLNDPGLKARCLVPMVGYYAQVGDYPNAIQIAKQAIPLAEEAGLLPEMAAAKNILSDCARHQGEYDIARAEATSGIDISARIEDPAGICKGLNSLSLNAIELGQFQEAAELLEHSLMTAREANLLEIQAQTQNNLGNIYGELGDLSSAFKVYEEALGIARRVGVRMGEGLVSTNLGWLSGLLGNYKAAAEYFAESIRIAKDIGDIYNQGYSLINQGLFACSEMKFDVAIAQLSTALEIMLEYGHTPGEAVAQTYLGHAYLGLGDLNAAKTAYQRGLDLRQEMGTQNLAMEPLAGLAEIAFHAGDLAKAGEITAKIITFLDDGGTLQGIDQPFRIYTACARILLELEDQTAGVMIQNSYQLLQEMAAKITDPQARRSYLTRVPWHLEMEKLYTQAKEKHLIPQT
jgi:tetratricopeptide (TPR) repeat protein